MQDISVPSYSHLLGNDAQIRTIMDLSEYIRNWKEAVDAYIASADAEFKGTYSSLEKLQALTDVNANDYAWVTDTDSVGNTIYCHYRHVNDSGWTYEYFY